MLKGFINPDKPNKIKCSSIQIQISPTLIEQKDFKNLKKILLLLIARIL